jgi:DNA-binding MarR family transcriptional regulator
MNQLFLVAPQRIRSLYTVPLDEQIFFSLRRISQAVETYSRFLWQEYGVTAPQLGALRELKQHVEVTPGRLAELMHISPQTVAGILSRLMQRGLIVRQRDERDRRSYIIQITDEGLRLADAAPSLLRDQFRAELARLEQWEQTQMLATLQRIADMMNAPDVAHEPFLVHDPPSAGATADQGAAPPPDEEIDAVRST